MLLIALEVRTFSSCHGKWSDASCNAKISSPSYGVDRNPHIPCESQEDSNPSTQEVGAVSPGQYPAPARISTNNYSSWSSSLQVSWKGEDCGKVNEFLLSSDDVSLPQSKSCMDTFLTPPLSLSTLCRSLKTAEKDLALVISLGQFLLPHTCENAV
jgi:hypothetical protein